MAELARYNTLKISALVASVAFLYASVLAKLGFDWWTDENYSHGLLVPLVIGFIIWREWDRLNGAVTNGSRMLGWPAIAAALLMLLAGTLGAELFTQRMSLVLMLSGLIVLLFGTRILTALAVPFVLLLLAIPIPQIIFNRIAMPLQTLASQIAVWGIRVFEVPTVRMGNVIDILPKGGIQAISLEVVEACSGIRSLMTLVTLALILAYFTRRDEAGPRVKHGGLSAPDLWRAILLMIAAVPIAVLTNAARVTATGVLTYYYGKQATDATWHDVSGWLVYVVALALLIAANFGLRWIFKRKPAKPQRTQTSATRNTQSAIRNGIVWPLVISFLLAGLAINWFVRRGEADIARRPLAEMPSKLGDWRQKGSEIRFNPAVESVLKTTDYTMREYGAPDGRSANIYVGYYGTQRTGATYHSPQNCLPGAGWVMHSGRSIDVPGPNGGSFKANLYIIENGTYKDVMIYWYQGRGHREASEYRDKLNTIWDSVTRRRTDGAFVRVMTDVGSDEAAATAAAQQLAAQLAAALGPFIPD